MDQRARLTCLLLLLSAALLAEPVNAKWWKPQGNPESGWNKILDWVLQPFKPKVSADPEKPPADPEKPSDEPSPIPPGDDMLVADPAKPLPLAGEDGPSGPKAIPEEQGSADMPAELKPDERPPPKEENSAGPKARPKPRPRPRQPGFFPFPKRRPGPPRFGRIRKPGKRFSKSRSRLGKPAGRSRSFSVARSRSFSVARSSSFSAAGSSSRRNRSRRF